MKCAGTICRGGPVSAVPRRTLPTSRLSWETRAWLPAASALRRMEELGLNIDHVQTGRLRPTGFVKVQLDGNALPRFEIAHPVAWDFMEWTEDWQHLAEKADAVCFGSLAQRLEVSRSIIRHLLQAMSPRTVKVFDADLRQSYYSPEVLTQSMRLADIAKLNDEELPKIMSLNNVSHKDELSSAEWLIRTYDLKLVSITLGGRGSLLVRATESSERNDELKALSGSDGQTALPRRDHLNL